MPTAYDPTRCDLCDSDKSRRVLQVEGRSLTSDSRVVPLDIEKVECSRCGLVRSGRPFAGADLDAHYRSAYVLAAHADVAEPLMPDNGKLVPRSQIFLDWIVAGLAQAGLAEPRSIVEAGCGEGRLLRRIAEHWPNAQTQGLELSSAAVEAASRRGLSVSAGGYEDLPHGQDLIYSVAVLEHLPSPRDFFAKCAAALSEDGALVVSQPAQDRPSSDIFFVDHLWHFAADHVVALAATAGLVPAAVVPSDTVPTFSLHVFVRGNHDTQPPTRPVQHAAREAVVEWQAKFRRLDGWLDKRDDRPLGVWGVGQTFDLLLAYTRLGGTTIAAGIEDNLARFPAGSRPFPVVDLETAAAMLRNPDVLLTFVPPPSVERRLAEKQLRFFAPLANDETR